MEGIIIIPTIIWVLADLKNEVEGQLVEVVSGNNFKKSVKAQRTNYGF